MINIKYLPFFIFLFCSIQFSSGQDKGVDSLRTFSLEELKQAYLEIRPKSKLKASYLDKHIEIAKRKNDTIHLAYAYMYKSYISEFKEAIRYSDTILNITKNIKQGDFPAEGHISKGYHYYINGNDDKSLSSFLKAYDIALERNNIRQQLYLNRAIAGIHNNLGSYSDALRMWKTQMSLLKKQPNFKEKYQYDYLDILDGLSKSYLRGRILDSAQIIVEKGINLSLKYNKSDFYTKFLLDSGVLFFYKSDYKKAMDSLLKVEPFLNNGGLLTCYYYQGKIYEITDKVKMEYYLNKVDSIYTANKILYPELKDVYKTLYEYHATKGNVAKQLDAVDKLIKIDSVLSKTIKSIDSQMSTDYEIPKLKAEKDKLIAKISDEKRHNKTIIVVAILVLVVFLFSFIGMHYANQKKYKKRFNILLEQQKVSSIKAVLILEDENSLTIPEEVVKDVLASLDKFEKQKQFLKKDISLTKLAKDFNTNTVYLSKIINKKKGISFSHYLNELRIKYCLAELKVNPKLRAYTIKAIAAQHKKLWSN